MALLFDFLWLCHLWAGPLVGRTHPNPALLHSPDGGSVPGVGLRSVAASGSNICRRLFGLCTVLERYREKLSDRRVEVVLGNVAVIPCTAVSRSVPPAHTQFEFNSARLRITSQSRGTFRTTSGLVVAAFASVLVWPQCGSCPSVRPSVCLSVCLSVPHGLLNF